MPDEISVVAPSLQAEILAMGRRIEELEAALKEALDYIDNPTCEIPGPTLIVLAGRRLLSRGTT